MTAGSVAPAQVELRAGDHKVIDALRRLVPNPKYLAKRCQGAA